MFEHRHNSISPCSYKISINQIYKTFYACIISCYGGKLKKKKTGLSKTPCQEQQDFAYTVYVQFYIINKTYKMTLY